MAVLKIKQSIIKTIIFDFDGTLAKLNIDFQKMREAIIALIYCPVVICRDDVNKVKPHPEHINFALTKLCSLTESTLMIGDHPLDRPQCRNIDLRCSHRTLSKKRFHRGWR